VGSQSVHYMPAPLPPLGAAEESGKVYCMKCQRRFKTKGYRYHESGRWVPVNKICGRCREDNKEIRSPRFTDHSAMGQKHRRGM